MKTVFRLPAFGGAVVALLFAVAYLAHYECGWPGGGGADGSNPLADLRKEQRYSEQLEERRIDFLRRRALKDEIAKEVIAHRVTLVEAAARFDELDQGALVFNWAEFRRAYPGRTDTERQCRQVIRCVKLLLEEQPGEMAAVVGRLEAELQEHLEQSGSIRLPDVLPRDGLSREPRP